MFHPYPPSPRGDPFSPAPSPRVGGGPEADSLYSTPSFPLPPPPNQLRRSPPDSEDSSYVSAYSGSSSSGSRLPKSVVVTSSTRYGTDIVATPPTWTWYDGFHRL